ncbi:MULTISPECIES: spore coat protein [Bacillus]|uniref:spore coat protein n=1 Tax=Bacillus TaxID=1386 RepID=UPI000BEB2D0B|nr:spore coat protein [Bacillus pseudomycoides]MCR8860010.1 spore coat protein [Bacillus pseudomycoides]PEF25478.1 spore coat protein [Bacillus pseudomycoides]PEP83651.1 spore coat protein [Bacillus pseudomycoides]PFW91787.1 spore coat protein [Bacillus pseudomycoides]PFX47501.1 spore coat protein [Bacillus pseudomycoides]
MQLATHELRDLSELIAGDYNTINTMCTYIQQAQDDELKQMLQNHLPLHVQDYNLKVEFIQGETTPNISKFQPSKLKPVLASYTEAPSQKYSPVTPSVIAQPPNDRAIATGYLLNQKSSAFNCAGSLLECANPELRTLLENTFLNSSHHAYDIWQYMVKKGYYQLSPAPSSEMQAIASMYQPINEG